MRRCCQKYHVPVFFVGKGPEKTVSLMAGLSMADTGVGFLDNDTLGAGPLKFIPAVIRLDEVEAYNRKGIYFEKRFTGRQSPIQAGGRPRPHDFTGDVEFPEKLLFPLVTQMRGTKDCEAFHLSPVEKFPDNKACLDGLSYSHIIGNEKADDVKFQGHHKGNELIGPRLDTDVPETAKRSRPRPQLEHHGIPQHLARHPVSRFFRVRRSEYGRFRRFSLQGKIDYRGILVAAAQGTKFKDVLPCFRKDHPFPSPSPDKASRLKNTGHH